MTIHIVSRQLTNQELDSIINEVKKFYSPIVGYKDKWKKFQTVYVATVNGNLAGVCGIEKINDWLFLHPFVVLEKYHGKGVGSLIVKRLISDNPTNSIFIGSQNPAVSKITSKSGFKRMNNLHALPIIVKLYLLKFTLESLNVAFIKEYLRKRSLSHGHFNCFIYKKKPLKKEEYLKILL